MDAVEAAGYFPTGRYIQLNSYENRVFDIELEGSSGEKDNVIAKFYRPGRWSQEALFEEHDFLRELKEAGIPAVAPLVQKNKSTISKFENMYVTFFPKAYGRMPQELSLEEFRRIGRTLAHLHNVGEQKVANNRPFLTAEDYGWPAIELLADWVAPEMWHRYEKAANEIIYFLEDHLKEEDFIRIHGDCHKGNLLLTDVAGEQQTFFFVDFDDFCNGPPAQDFWMLFSSEDSEEEQNAILEGYEDLRQFDRSQLELMKALRGLRIFHYDSWIAKRWSDPSFPQLFPHFRSYTYWAENTEALEHVAWGL